MTEWRLPAEWEPQQAIMLTWPTANSDWSVHLEEVSGLYVSLAETISQYQEVILVFTHPAHKIAIEQLLQTSLSNLENIHFYQAETDDTWARDHGPLTIKQADKRKILDFTFNGWGNKYNAIHDNEITYALVKQRAFPGAEYEKIDFILEGGAIDSNGQGLLLTTSTCLLNPNRNSQLDKSNIEKQLKHYFGIQQILWLDHAYLIGDDTDGHIDMLARFCNAHTICYTQCTDVDDEHYSSLKAMENELLIIAEQANHPLQLIPLPLPTAVFYQEERLPASYCNFLITNKQVILPIYGVPEDKHALSILQELFPSREVVGIDARVAIRQGGSLHCLTMQIPA